MPDQLQPDHSISQELATRVALIYKQLYGRGPKKITAHILPGAVICLLEGITTPGQDKLAELDELGLVTTVHARLQRAVASELIAAVEDLTGRTVRSYAPGFDATAGTGTDTFFLHPPTT